MTSLIEFFKTTPTEVVPSPPIKPLNETLEILSKVNEFYDTSWSKLIWLLTGAFAILAVIVPIAVQILQKKSLEASEKLLSNKITEEIEKAKTDIEQKIISDIEKKLSQNENNLKKIVFDFKGRTMHLQGNSSFGKADYFGALKDYCYSANSYSSACENANLGIVLDSIQKTLVHISKEQLDQINKIDGINLKEILNKIEKKQGETFEKKSIRAIRERMYELQKQ